MKCFPWVGDSPCGIHGQRYLPQSVPKVVARLFGSSKEMPEPIFCWGYKIELFFKFNHCYKLFIFRFTPKIRHFSLIIGMPANSKMVRLSTFLVLASPTQDRACCLAHHFLTMLSWPDGLSFLLLQIVRRTSSWFIALSCHAEVIMSALT